MATQLAQLRPSGIVADHPPEMVPPERWTGGNNILFRDKLTTRAPGWAPTLGALLEAPEHLLFAPISGTSYWIYAAPINLYVTDGVSQYDITPTEWTTGTIVPNSHVSDTLNGIPVITNGIDEPAYWAGATGTPADILPDWPAGFACNVLKAYKFYLVAMNIRQAGGSDPQLVQWSDAAAPGTIPQSWTVGASSDAGSNSLAEPTGSIEYGLGLRDDFIIYKTNSTHLMQFVGGDEVFEFRTLFTDSGIMASNCAVEVRGNHYVLTDSDIVMHDGQTMVSIIDENIRGLLFQLIDPDAFRVSHVVFNEESNELLFNVPATGSTRCNFSVVYSFEDDDWGIRAIPDVSHMARGLNPTAPPGAGDWDSDTEAWDDDVTLWNQQNLFGATTVVLIASPVVTKVYELDSSVTADGAAIVARVDRESLDLGSPNVNKIVRRVWPKITGAPSTDILIRVGGQQELNDPIAFSPVVSFNLGTDRSVDVAVIGKFISIEFLSDAPDIWVVSGFEIEYEERGRF